MHWYFKLSRFSEFWICFLGVLPFNIFIRSKSILFCSHFHNGQGEGQKMDLLYLLKIFHFKLTAPAWNLWFLSFSIFIGFHWDCIFWVLIIESILFIFAAGFRYKIFFFVHFGNRRLSRHLISCSLCNIDAQDTKLISKANLSNQLPMSGHVPLTLISVWIDVRKLRAAK